MLHNTFTTAESARRALLDTPHTEFGTRAVSDSAARLTAHALTSAGGEHSGHTTPIPLS